MINPVKLFIVEGEKKDYRFIDELTKCFFKGKYSTKIIKLPASQNIYMLYKKLIDDNFETDIVELLRDSDVGIKSILEGIPRQNIDEIYLFFDFDIHQDNLGKNDNDRFDVVRKMLDFFNNETENGKLYISYPMVEALYDYKNGLCESNYNCFISIDVVKDYKKLSSDNNDNVNRTKDFNSWRSILNVFSLKIKCLFDLDELNFTIYRDKVST